MNIHRYLMPAVIAASLHTSLAYFFSDRCPPPPPPVKDPPVVLPEVPRIEIIPDETVAAASGETGGVSELPPMIPEMPPDSHPEDIIRIEVKPRAESIKPVADLPRLPTGIGDPGDGSGIREGVRNVIRSVDLDRIPRATVQPAPVYPASLRDTDGSVTVEFVVDTTGRVVSADAVRWTHREFVDPAVRAVLRWRFEPGTLNGRKVSFRMAVPIEFNAAH